MEGWRYRISRLSKCDRLLVGGGGEVDDSE